MPLPRPPSQTPGRCYLGLPSSLSREDIALPLDSEHVIKIKTCPGRGDIDGAAISTDQTLQSRVPQDILRSAIKKGDTRLLQSALEGGADANMRDAKGYTPLHAAANTTCSNSGVITELLLRRKADPDVFVVDFIKEMGEGVPIAPLHIAAQRGNGEVAQQLLKGDAHIDIVDPVTFWTPLLLAVASRRTHIVRLLLAKGAKVDGDHRASTNPLLEAVGTESIELVQILLRWGANINRLDMDGDPAIHTAALKGSMDIVMLLLSTSEGNLDLKGATALPAWWYARNSGHHEMERLLKKIDAYENIKTIPADLVDDTASTFNEIGVTKVLNDIARAQQFAYRVEDSTRSGTWRERVRFVVKAKEENPFDLELIEPYVKNQDSLEPFIAVSYSWASQTMTQQKPLLIKVPNRSGSGSLIRPLRARPELVRRILDFARSRGIQRVWIDQECIHQDDEEDRRILVSKMHYIYRHATFTLAMLGKHIHSIEDIETIQDIFGKETYKSETSERTWRSMGTAGHAFILTSRIFHDKWCTRSWTTQEALSTISHSGNLLYVVEWDDGFDQSGSCWAQMAASLPPRFPEQTMPRNLVLDWTLVFDLISHPTVRRPSSAVIRSQSRRNASFTRSAADPTDRSWYRFGTSTQGFPLLESERAITSPEGNSTAIFPSPVSPTQSGLEDLMSHPQPLSEMETTGHHVMALIVAIAALRSKRSLMVSDKLSILANVCGYEYHLNVQALVQENPSISFSACALALAFANGDVSALTDHDPLKSLQNSKPSIPSWLLPHEGIDPARPPCQHAWMGKITTVGNPCVLVKNMLVAHGILWKIAPCEDLLPLQEIILESLEVCRHVPSKSISAGIEVLKATLRCLFYHGREQLAGLIVTLALSRSWESPAEYCLSMRDLQSWYVEGSSWPSLPWGTPQEPDYTQKPGSSNVKGVKFIGPVAVALLKKPATPPSALDRSLDRIPTAWGCTLLRWLYLCAAKGLPFPLGRSSSLDGLQEIAVFKMSLDSPTTTFVPISEINYRFGGDRFVFPSPRAFWRVSSPGVPMVSEEEKASAVDQLVKMEGKTLGISEEKLTIKHEIDMEGCWSPLLSASGVLRWDESQSFSLMPLGDLAQYHFIT